MGRRCPDGQRPLLRQSPDGEHQLCRARQQRVHRTIPRADRLRQIYRPAGQPAFGWDPGPAPGDLRAGRRTTDQRLERCITHPTLKEATPGDLNLVLPYRYVVNILEMLEALDQVAPGVASRHTLLYGVEAKFYSSRLKLSPDLETGVHNLFAAGDGAGVTRGLVQASASGLIAAREVLRRL